MRVSNIFAPLPVRRNELLRTVKAQYNKAISTMYSYAVIHPNVRFICQTSNGNKGKSNKRHNALSTQGGAKTTTRQAISSVFGIKFLKNLIPLSVDLSHFVEKEEEPLAAEGNDSTSKEGLPTLDSNGLLGRSLEQKNPTSFVAKITGWISKAGTGVGRSNNDRQFVFINQRPVDIPKLTRTMNSVWRLYEMKHKPAYILNLTLPPGSFDVNVTPDKRQVLLTNEAHILEPLEEAIKKFWETSQYTYKVRDISSHFSGYISQSC